MLSQSSWKLLLSAKDGLRDRKPGVGGEEDRVGVLIPDGGELSFAEEVAEPLVAVRVRSVERRSPRSIGSDRDFGASA